MALASTAVKSPAGICGKLRKTPISNRLPSPYLRDETAHLNAPAHTRCRTPALIHCGTGEDAAGDGEPAVGPLTATMPDARLQMVPGAGHRPWLDDPAAAAEGHAVLSHPPTTQTSKVNLVYTCLLATCHFIQSNLVPPRQIS